MKQKEKKKKRDDSDIPSIIDRLPEDAKREILERWITEQRDIKDKQSISSYKKLSISFKPDILGLHRSTFYKTNKTERKYKFDFIKDEVIEIFEKNRHIYGSRKILVVLQSRGYNITDISLRNCMNRRNLRTKTRVARKRRKSKNINVKYKDIVKRNFKPKQNNIVATEVSYIPTNVIQNNVYLSVAISHKTKLVEAWKLSSSNDTSLVIRTLKDLKRKKIHTSFRSWLSIFNEWSPNTS